MRICIEKEFLGTSAALAVESDGSCEWSDAECDAYLYSTSWRPVPFEDIAKMQGIELERFELAPASQIKAFEALGVDMGSVPWAMALGRSRFSRRIQDLTEAIRSLTGDVELCRYVETYGLGRKMLKGLWRPSIDESLLREYHSGSGVSPSVAGTLLSFNPDDSGLALEVLYDRTATATGRLTVAAGPRILTLPRENRDILRSTQGGAIFEVDFVSLEPRLALLLAGAKPPRDIYEDIRARIKVLGISRKDIKLAVISALYGSSSGALAETLGSRKIARELTQEVKDLFQVDTLVSRLRDHMSTHGNRLHNYFGRPLQDLSPGDKDSKLINYYVQSSAVDVALLGFSQVVEHVRPLGVKPIYVIHDAILFDVPSGAEESFYRACELGVDLNVGHFELGIKRVSK